MLNLFDILGPSARDWAPIVYANGGSAITAAVSVLAVNDETERGAVDVGRNPRAMDNDHVTIHPRGFRRTDRGTLVRRNVKVKRLHHPAPDTPSPIVPFACRWNPHDEACAGSTLHGNPPYAGFIHRRLRVVRRKRRYPTFSGTSVIVSFPNISITLTATV